MSLLWVYSHPFDDAVLVVDFPDQRVEPGSLVTYRGWPNSLGVAVANTDREGLTVLWANPPGLFYQGAFV